jgi:transposase
LERSPSNNQRHSLDTPNWRALARPPSALRIMEISLRSIQPMVEERDLRQDRRSCSCQTRRRGQDRSRSMVRGWKFDSSDAGSSRRWKKGGPDEPADHALGRSRGGFGTKFHLVCDSRGIPLAVELSPGQTHDSQRFEAVMEAVRIPQRWASPRRRPKRLAADKAYGSRKIREWLRRHRIRAVIPTKSNEKRRSDFDREAYRGRNVVERCISWLKECRRVATRYEKLARNFLAMVKLAIIDRLFRMS